MVLVNCFVHGDIDEAGTMCSFHAPVPLNFFQLNEYFPFAGNFHFRLKTPGASVGLTGIDYVWFDILKNDEPLPIPPSNDVVEIRALVLDLPNEYTNDEDYADYLEEINQGLGVNPHERPNRSFAETKKTGRGLLQKISQGVSKTKSAAKTINMQSVAKGATSLWNTVKATASHIQQSIAVKTSMLSDASEENLANLSEDLASVFSESRHSNLLKELWRVMFPDRQFERNSLIWREAGWQQQDPVTDLKASGILAVRTMTFMCRTFPERSQDMLTRNKANIKANYPFAIVGINLTLLLADLIGLKDQKYFSMQSGYWELFEDSSAFFELFCICFFHVDSIWTHRKAVRADFAKIIGETKALVSQVLQQAPKSVQEFKFLAAEEGMVVVDL